MQYLNENKNIPQKLEQSIKNNPKLHSYFDINFQGIKPKNYCGFLSIDNQSYFIVPKITDDNNQKLNDSLKAEIDIGEKNAFRHQGDNWGNAQRMKFGDIE